MKSISHYITKALETLRSSIRFVNETGTVTPQCFGLFGLTWLLSNCSKVLKKSEREKILGANVLKRIILFYSVSSAFLN